MKIPKREDELKARLFAAADECFKQFLPAEYFLLPIQDVRKSGTPDFTLNGHDKTTWWEVKHATPHFISTGIQEVICYRLARRSFCRYIIYVEASNAVRGDSLTVILHPEHVMRKDGRLNWDAVVQDADAVFDGHNHHAIVTYMLDVHTS